jgi:hypothetical protein
MWSCASKIFLSNKSYSGPNTRQNSMIIFPVLNRNHFAMDELYCEGSDSMRCTKEIFSLKSCCVFIDMADKPRHEHF